ncbi:uncharacterized protein C11orf24 homolog [Suricata suricatta]|uniref:Prostate androgen-regulated mucin-like protein 1 n=1 Tax=Suricata suricatta TaxID=37032 RepID=A0A673THB4_SURSU|nr:uncharacterized protein C11orf24 homolog [Suricata suricatta]
MWTALVLVWISSLSLSESQVQSQDPGHLVSNQTATSAQDTSVSTAAGVLNGTSGTMTVLTSAVTLATGTRVSDPRPPAVTARGTFRTDTAVEGTPGPAASGGPAPASPVSTWRTPVPTPAPDTPPAPGPSVSPLASTAAPTTPATIAQTAAGTTASAHSPTGTHSPSTAHPAHPPSPLAPHVSTQGLTVRASAARPTTGPASGHTPALANTTPEPTLRSTAPVTPGAPASTTAVTTAKTQAREPAASTALAPDPSPTPRVEATSTTTQPGPALSPRGAVGPGMPPTPEQVRPETPPGTASTAPVPGSSGGASKVPASALCPLSTQGQYLVVTTEPLTRAMVNTSFLLAVLLLGVALFFVALVLLLLQAYEGYRKKEYTQVDYLINGMYADSEM